MSKEKEMSTKEIIQGVSSIGMLVTLFFGSIYLMDKGQNYLSYAKEEAKNPPPTLEQVCNENNYFAEKCFTYVVDVLCDGQETFFNFKDDVCEPISYWKYMPEKNYSRP